MKENKINAIPIAKPFMDGKEEDAVAETLRSGWVSQGPKVQRFEELLQEYLNVRYVRMVNSGTSALMLSIKALNIGPGDSVVIPAYTCAATALPILAMGANVIFADIEPDSCSLSWSEVDRVLTKDTRCVVLVHLFGLMADYRQIVRECKDRNINLLEDAALSLGSSFEGKFAGTIGDAGCFSFHPRKMITTGEGGAIATNKSDIAFKIDQDRNYGAVSSAWQRFKENDSQFQGFTRLAFNMKMTDIQASIGIVQMNRLQSFIERRRQIARMYESAFLDNPVVKLFPKLDNVNRHVYQAFVAKWMPEPLETLISNQEKFNEAVSSFNEFIGNVRAAQVAVSAAAQYLPDLPVLKQFAASGQKDPYPNARILGALTFALPIFPTMTDSDVNRVVMVVNEVSRKIGGN